MAAPLPFPCFALFIPSYTRCQYEKRQRTICPGQDRVTYNLPGVYLPCIDPCTWVQQTAVEDSRAGCQNVFRWGPTKKRRTRMTNVAKTHNHIDDFFQDLERLVLMYSHINIDLCATYVSPGVAVDAGGF